jgi:hypothetical protein
MIKAIADKHFHGNGLVSLSGALHRGPEGSNIHRVHEIKKGNFLQAGRLYLEGFHHIRVGVYDHPFLIQYRKKNIFLFLIGTD